MTTDHTSPARTAAELLVDQGEVHYASEGQAQCLSGRCTTAVGP
ncbi:hypothetical protein [Streptomyces sp. NPDC045714]